MKGMKIAQYAISLIHLVLQIFYFIQWNQRMSELDLLARKIDAATISNANLAMSQESFVFLGLAILTLAFYLTISIHLSRWIDERRIEKAKEKAK